jgi:hypothetical protein
MTDNRCSKDVYPNDRWGSFHPHKCKRSAWKDGFCKTHHPEEVKKRRDILDKRYSERLSKNPLIMAHNRIRELEARIEELQEHIQQHIDMRTH